MKAHRLGFTLALCLGGHWLGAGEAPPVRLDARGDELVLANGVVELRLAKDGALVALSRAGGENLLANGGRGYWNAASAAAKQTHGFVALAGPVQVVRQTDDLAEIAFRHEPGGRWPVEAFGFDARLHYVLRRGESGFHLFMTAAHRAGMPPASYSQFAYNLRLDPKRFDYIAVDDRRRHVSHTCDDERRAAKIMDATFRLADGTVVSKYDYCHDLELDDYHAYGWASPREGVWLIQPSAEYYPCTPFKLVLTAHQTATTPVIVWQPHCTHGGGVELRCGQGEEWHKLYGPAFVYVNAGDGHDALWRDASRAAREQAGQWPCRWMQHPWFPVERGAVTGRLQFGDGRPARDAFVILSPPGMPWSAEGRGYHFWARTDAEGRFALEHVREGTYALTATGADEFDEFARGPVEVKAGQTATLGTLTWTPTAHGRRLWQLGVADRTPGEFRNGDDYHHWGLWRRYPEQFPAGVRFVIGQSKERADWNFAHWNWHCGDPAWTIEFESHAASRGKATLTFGIAAALPYDPGRKLSTARGTTDVRVAVNDQEVGRIELPSTGGIGYRSARRSAMYHVVRLPFDAALLKEGRNAVTLRHAHSDAYAPGDPIGEQGAGPGYVMYDAIRLELDERP